MNTIEDIIEWIRNYDNPNENIEAFAYELGEMLKDMDYTASNGGAAVGYAGVTGSYKDISTGIYLTVENIVNGSNGEYSFINNGVNILNNKEFEKALRDAVGDNASSIINGTWNEDGTRSIYSFGEAVALNDIVSKNFMSVNARGNVMLIIAESAASSSVLAMTELPELISNDKVTHILGIPKEDLINLSNDERFQVLKERSLAMQAEADIFRGTIINANGSEVTVELLSLENTEYAEAFEVSIPEGFVRIGSYYERLQENGVRLFSDEQLCAKYGFLGDGTSPEILDVVRIAEYRGDASKLKLLFDDAGMLVSAQLCDYPVSISMDSGLGVTSFETSIGELNRTIVDYSRFSQTDFCLTDLQKAYVIKLQNEVSALKDCIKVLSGEAGIDGITLRYDDIAGIVDNGVKVVDFINSNGTGIVLSEEESRYVKLINDVKGYIGTLGGIEYEGAVDIQGYIVNRPIINESEISILKDFIEFAEGTGSGSLVSGAQAEYISTLNKLHDFAVVYNELPAGIKNNGKLWNELKNMYQDEVTFNNYSVTNANFVDDMINCAKNLKTYSKICNAVNKFGAGVATVLIAVDAANTVCAVATMISEGRSQEAADYLVEKTSDYLGYGVLGIAMGAAVTSGFVSTMTGVMAATGPVGMIGALLITYGLPYFVTSEFGEAVSEVVQAGMEIAVDFAEDVIEGVSDFVDMIGDWWSDLWGNAKSVRVDPLIDLKGDGYSILTKDKGVNFDLDNNGFAERISWTKTEGILALDLNGNGRIDNGGELFGDKTLLSNGEYALNGFEALAEYDTNQDGIIDEEDEIFSKLLVWVDDNADGISGEGELKHLSELGIKAIELNYESVDIDVNSEASISHSARVIFEDGSDTSVGELWVSLDRFDTINNMDIELSDEIRALPDVSGAGNIMSLRNAMQLDATGTVKGLVKSFMSSSDKSEREKIVDELLINLAGAKDVAADSRGAYFNGQKLAVLESFFGEKFVGYNGANPNSKAAPDLERLYSNIAERYYFELLVKGSGISSYVALIKADTDASSRKIYDTGILCKYLQFAVSAGIADERIVGDISGYLSYAAKSSGIGDLYSGFRNYVAENMPDYASVVESNIAGRIFTGDENIRYSGFADNDFIITGAGSDTVNAGAGNDVVFGGAGDDYLNGGAGNDYIYGEEGNDTIDGGNGNDTIYGGAGNDYLRGGSGNDTYVIGLGDGNDRISDDKGKNVIRFKDGIRPEDLIASYGTDYSVILTNRNSGDSIEILNFRREEKYRNFVMVFDDGTEMKFDDERSPFRNLEGTAGDDVLSAFYSGIRYHAGAGNDWVDGSSGNDEMYGEAGDDYLSGGAGDDILEGGSGNDRLYGGSGNDTYVIGLGDGNDRISDDKGKNVIRFKDGIRPEDLIASYGDDYSVILTNRKSKDSVEILKFRKGTDYRSFVMVFDDGTEMKFNDERSPLRNLEGTSGDDVLSAFYSGIRYHAGAGNDRINGSSGNDEMYGEEGDDYLSGGAGDDILNGGSGNDYLAGTEGNDTYVIGLGDGNDRIYDASGENIISFKDGIRPEDLIASYGDDYSVILTNRKSKDSVEILKFRKGTDYRSFVMVFDDGTEMKFNDERSPLRNLEGTSGDDVLSAFYSGIRYHAGAGNDRINGSSGNDEMYGEEGDDYLSGGAGDDILDGGSGNDYLAGTEGNDTYVIGLGDGNDRIYDASGENIISFKDGIRPEDLIASYGDDYSVILTNRKSKDSVEILKFRKGTDYRSFVMVFDDGTEMKFNDERSPLRNLEGTSGDDVLSAFYSGIRYHAGAGNDRINGSSGNDEMYGEEGDDYLSGGAGDDILDGGSGNDYLAGTEGNDTYVIGLGDGNDRIYDASGENIISFKDGIRPEDLTVTYGKDYGLILTNESSGDSIEILNFRRGEEYRRFTLSFDDGRSATIDYANKKLIYEPLPEAAEDITEEILTSTDISVTLQSMDAIASANAAILSAIVSADDIDFEEALASGAASADESGTGGMGYSDMEAYTDLRANLLVQELSAAGADSNIYAADYNAANIQTELFTEQFAVE